jgi:hypothetical protein
MACEQNRLRQQRSRARRLRDLQDRESRYQFLSHYKQHDSQYTRRPLISPRKSFQITAKHESFQAFSETPQDAFWLRSSSPAPRRLADTTFRYKDLDPMQNEIRLLRILPETTSIIKCEVLHTSLDCPQSYIAISYAWGDSEDTRTIMLSGHEFAVTESLWLALQRLRSRWFPVIVWADAVCINQRNTNERNLQVQAMTSIYSKAYTVAIWLGPEADNSNMALELLSEIVKSQESSARIREIIKSPIHRACFKALVVLFDRDYWKRLWVVQEVMNAKDITVYCGPYALPWDTYATASRLFWQYQPDLIRAFLNPWHLSQELSSSGQTWAEMLGAFGPGRLTSGSKGLLEALLYHRGKSCAEPRDRVYGILGILSANERSQFLVDYDISVRQVYINVVDCLLTTTRRLDVICASFHFPAYPSVERLPSWVPDWSSNPRVSPLGHGFPGFSAAGTTEARFAFSSRRRKLGISAIFVDKIGPCGMHLGPPTSMCTILMAFFQWRLKLIATKGYDLIEHEAFCRTLCCDQTHDRWTSRQWLEWTYYAFATLLRERLPDLDLDPQLTFYANNSTPITVGLREQMFSDYIMYAMAGRRFSISSLGLLCLGSGASASGDVICVPLGCSTPIILRKQSQGYTYIGVVYVDGYMYGRATEELNNGTRQLQTFVIH